MKRIIKQVEFPAEAPKLTRVAAYARVSSGKDAMLHSLSTQVSYYSDLIQKHPGWQYCGVYADEALTGTKDTRENFQRLLNDCRAGKIEIKTAKLIQFDFSQCRNVLRGKLLGPRGKFGEMRGKLLREG